MAALLGRMLSSKVTKEIWFFVGSGFSGTVMLPSHPYPLVVIRHDTVPTVRPRMQPSTGMRVSHTLTVVVHSVDSQ